MINWNPLETDGPVVPRCKACGGRGLTEPVDYKPAYKCQYCNATGLAQPSKCEECGGSGEVPHGDEDHDNCPSCSGTGHAPWKVLVDRDVFWGDWIPIPEAVTEDCNAGYRKLLTTEQLASIFATIAPHPEMQFYLPIETVESAEKAKAWMQYDGDDPNGRLVRVASNLLCLIKKPGFEWPGWPLPNLTILAVAHDQPSLDAVLPAVLKIPAAAHGVWIREAPMQVDIRNADISVLLVDHAELEGPTHEMRPKEGYTLVGYAERKLWQENALAAATRAREAGVRVAEVEG